MSCPVCGTPHDPGARFCRACGTPLTDADATTPVPARTGTAGATVDDEDDDPTDPGPVATSAVVTPPVESLRECPSCGATNSPRRVLCGRCGADLESGNVVEPRPRPTRPAVVAAPAATRKASSGMNRTVVAIVTAALLVGAGLGAMVALGIGPFAPADGPPPAMFDRSDYPGAPGPLDDPGISVGVSTTHQSTGDRSYGAARMLDDDPTTAWNSSGQTNPGGVGERIRVEFPEPVWLTRIVVENGDGHDHARFLGNARIKRAAVMLDAGVSFTVLLEDVQGPQVIMLDVPELTTGLRIEVLEVYPGDTYDDLAVSELDFEGYVATAEDAEVAAARARYPRTAPSEVSARRR